MKDILKKINKKEKVIIGLTLGVLLIAFVSITLKDTHAYYSDKTEISLFNAKIGNFKPILNTFYIKDANTPKYTNQNSNTVYLTWGDNNKNINEMCITEGDVDSCKWETISNNTQYTFDSDTEGEKTIKGYIRDKVGIKSAEKSDTIIYDKTTPTIESATAEDITQTSFTINITANDNKEGVSKTSGIDKYCYGTEDSLLEEKYTCVENSKIAIDNLEAEHSYTYYIYVKDKAGNGSPTNKQSIIFKTEDIPRPVLEMLTQKGGDTFKEQSGMYRFVGTYSQVQNNYICFGTTDIAKCTTPTSPGEANYFLYRIIGLTSEDDNTIGLKANQLKLLGEAGAGIRVWANGDTKEYCETDGIENGKCSWDGSTVKDYLNTKWFNLASSKWWDYSTSEITLWKGLITSQSWYNQVQSTNLGAVPEPTGSHTEKCKIGLRYLTDVMNAGGNAGWMVYSPGFLMTIMGLDEWSGRYQAWSVNYDTYMVGTYGLHGVYFTNPVFYVSPNITLTGEGTVENPFIIHTS